MGIFSCGNVLHVHDLVDFVSEEAEIAGKSAAEFVNGGLARDTDISIKTDGKIRYTVPQKISVKKDLNVYFRVGNVYRNSRITVRGGEKIIFSKKKEKLAPGEMECIKLTREMLEGVSTLSFSVEEA